MTDYSKVLLVSGWSMSDGKPRHRSVCLSKGTEVKIYIPRGKDSVPAVLINGEVFAVNNDIAEVRYLTSILLEIHQIAVFNDAEIVILHNSQISMRRGALSVYLDDYKIKNFSTTYQAKSFMDNLVFVKAFL